MTGPEARVARVISVYTGGSTSPALVETETEERFVMKFSGAGPGPRALLTEYLATRIAGRMGLAVPEARPLWLPDPFPWQAGTDEFDAMLQRSYGWNLGLRHIADARALTAADLPSLPGRFRACLRRVDRLLQNIDRTAANPNLLQEAGGRVWAIDHNACLFLERIAAGRRPFPFDLPANHLLAGLPADDGDEAGAEADGLDETELAALAAPAPESWFESLPFPRAGLAPRLAAYVDAFRRAG